MTLLAGVLIGAAIASGVWIVYVNRIGADLAQRAKERKPLRIGNASYVILTHRDYVDLMCTPRRWPR